MKKKSTFSGILPDGKRTINIERYVRAYRKLKNVMASVWPEQSKFQVGYEPGIQMGLISLSSLQAIQLYEKITGKKYTC